MDKLWIRGGQRLAGALTVSGAKNAALPLMCASLLTDQPLRLSRTPRLADMETLSQLLLGHGVHQTVEEDGPDGRAIRLHAARIDSVEAPYELVRRMRAGVLVLGPLLARCGQARVSLPGGCAIGARPVDLHLKGLEQLGARITLENGYIVASTPSGGLHGADITFPLVSVGATENLLLAATLARGTTRLRNAAREPEVMDLIQCLKTMGARIDEADGDALEIVGSGGAPLRGGAHAVIPDRIEAASLIMATAATRGRLRLRGARTEQLGATLGVLAAAGVTVAAEADGLQISCDALTGTDAMTEPYPGFPTDLQAQLMAMLATADGASMITETIFENRFMHVPELRRMGARITLHGRSAMVRGTPRLTGAPVMATDLRASMSLVVAAVAAEGETVIDRVYHLDRGYERLEEKLAACGAEIRRLRTGDPSP